MNSTVVNARVPVAKREAAAPLLESLGATTSDLINSAYEFLLENGELPCSRNAAKPSQEGFASFLRQSTLSVDWGDESQSSEPDAYKRILREGKRADYESLA